MTAVVEVGIGLALLSVPAFIVPILIGASFDTAADSIVGRVGGAGLLSLGVASWLARNDEQSRAAAALIASLLLYNISAAVILAYAGVGLRLFGIGLWPAFVLHVGMAVWCFISLRNNLAGRPSVGAHS